MLATKNTAHTWFTDLIFLFLGLTGFYFLFLGHYPLFTPDEGRYSEVAREMLVTGDFITPRVNGVIFLDKPILYYWLQALAMYWFGVTEWAIRFFPALSGICSCLFTYLCTRKLFNRRTALFASFILALSPLYFASSHYADLNIEVAVFISGSLLAFITGTRMVGYSRMAFLLLAYVFAALAFLTKGMIGIVLPSMVIGLWILLTWQWSLLKNIYLLPGLLLFSLLVAPWYWLVQKANPEFFQYFFISQQVGRFLSNGTFNNPSPGWFYLPIILAGFFPWSIFFFSACKNAIYAIVKKSSSSSLELFLLLWFSVIFTFFSIPHSKTIGYILPLFPPLAILVGNYLATTWKKIPAFDFYLCPVLFIILSGLMSYLFLSLPHSHLLPSLPTFSIYSKLIATIFIISGLLSILFISRYSWRSFVTLCATCNMLLLLLLLVSSTELNENTTKPLASTLNQILKPEDEVVNYFKFYQDLPLYLQRRITLVADWDPQKIMQRDDWKRELWFGINSPQASSLLINENVFIAHWNNANKRIFVFVNKNYFEQFKKQVQHHFFYVDNFHDTYLLSNCPIS